MIFLKLINEININIDICLHFAFIAKHFSQGVSKNLLSNIYIYRILTIEFLCQIIQYIE